MKLLTQFCLERVIPQCLLGILMFPEARMDDDR